MNNNQLIMWAADFYLTESLTEELLDGDENVLDEFLTMNAWEPFINWKPNDLYREITDLAESAGTLLKQSAWMLEGKEGTGGGLHK